MTFSPTYFELTDEHSVADIDGLLKQLDMATPRAFGGRKVPFTCRVWVWMAVSALNDAGIILCPDYKALDEECQDFAADTQTRSTAISVHISVHSN